MTLRALVLAAVFSSLALLSSPSLAAGNEVGWNPFLFIFTCSFCGPLTPLTMEQADGGEVLAGGVPSAAGDVNDDAGDPGTQPASSGHDLDGAPGVVNANGLGVSAGPVAGIGMSIAGESGEGLKYGLMFPNTGSVDSSGAGSSSNLNHDAAITFTLGGPPVIGADQSTRLLPTPLSPTGGSGSGSGTGETLIPEPTSILLFGTGLAALGALSRRKTRSIQKDLTAKTW